MCHITGGGVINCEDIIIDKNIYRAVIDNKIQSISICKNLKCVPNFLDLKELWLSQSCINVVPNISSLVALHISGTIISNIPDTLINLKELDIEFSNCTSIPDTLINLEYLNASNTEITTLPDTLTCLKHLYIYNTPISTISDTFINLKILECPCTNIDKIPDSICNLDNINCSNTFIKSLPKRHSESTQKLWHLSCDLDMLSNLSTYTITSLDCSEIPTTQDKPLRGYFSSEMKPIRFIKNLVCVHSTVIIISKSNYSYGQYRVGNGPCMLLPDYNTKTTIGSQYIKFIVLYKVLLTDIYRTYIKYFCKEDTVDSRTGATLQVDSLQ